MFKEILKILPKLDSASLAGMERTLSSRFTRVAKKFGKGLFNAVKGAGIIGLAVGFLDKLLNPIGAAQEAIDKMLGSAGDFMVNAEQFGSSAGELFKLTKLAQAKGLDQESLNQMLTKYQSAIAEAQADPTKDTSVRAYANDTNMVQSMFQFMQSLNKMDRNQQVLVQREVFGEKATLRMADFMRTDFAELSKAVGARDASSYQPGLEKLDRLSDLADNKQVGRELEDMIKKSRIINEGMINSRDKAATAELDRENKQIASYENLAAISTTMTKVTGLVEEGMAKIGQFIDFATPAVNKGIEAVERISKSRFIQGIFGGK